MGDTGTGGATLASAPTEPRVRLPVAVLVVVATVVVALLVVALVVRLGADRLPSGPPRDPPSPPPQAMGLTLADGQARFEGFEVTFPGPPFRCGGQLPPSPAFTQLSVCGTTVHRDFDGKGSNWIAVVGVGLVDDTRVRPGDPTATTRSVFDALVALNYRAGDHAVVSAVAHGPADISAPAGSATTRSARVTVRHRGLATPYDKLVVIVVRLADGRHVAYFSDFPHDGSARALSAVIASVSSIRVQR